MAPPAAEEPEKDEEEAASDSGSDSEEEEEKKSSKKRKSNSPKTAPKASARTYSKKVDRMRSLCRQATITIPPNIYVKNKTDKELEAAFEALLEKNGLSADAGANEVAKVKAQLQIQRDLDGIDTSNIISDGRRARRGGATNYKEMLQAASDSEEEQEENSDEGSDSESDKEQEASPPEKKKKKAASPAPDPVSAKKESPKIENSPHQAKKAIVTSEPQSSGKQGDKALVDIGNNQKKGALADWSDDE
jgi:hypothetical protein